MDYKLSDDYELIYDFIKKNYVVHSEAIWEMIKASKKNHITKGTMRWRLKDMVNAGILERSGWLYYIPKSFS